MEEKNNENEIRLELEDLEPIVTKVPGVVPKKELNSKQKVVRAILSIIGVIVVFRILIWSVNTVRYSSDVYIQQDVLRYLEKRYGEEFEIESYRGTSFAYNYVQAYAHPVGKQDDMYKFEIQGYENKLGGLNYYDTYVMVKITKEYEDYVDTILAEYFDEYKFYMDFSSEWITNSLPPDTKLEDLWGLQANVDYPLPTILVYLPSTEKKTSFVDLGMQLSQHNFRGRIAIKSFMNDEKYALKSRNDWAEPDGAVDIAYKVHSIWVYSEGTVEQLY